MRQKSVQVQIIAIRKRQQTFCSLSYPSLNQKALLQAFSLFFSYVYPFAEHFLLHLFVNNPLFIGSLLTIVIFNSIIQLVLLLRIYHVQHYAYDDGVFPFIQKAIRHRQLDKYKANGEEWVDLSEKARLIQEEPEKKAIESFKKELKEKARIKAEKQCRDEEEYSRKMEEITKKKGVTI